ncbi:MAG: type II secretion system protein GspG [Myxococcota bacterium]
MPSSKIILLVLFIGGGLAALLLARRELARQALDPSVHAQHQLGAIQMSLERFLIDSGRYPTEAEGLAALTTRPATLPSRHWRGPYLEETGNGDPLRDPWNRPFRYRVLKNSRGMAYTLGADDAPGGEGENSDVMGIAETLRGAEAERSRSGSVIDSLMQAGGAKK